MKKLPIILTLFSLVSLSSCGKPEIDTSRIALDYGQVYKGGITDISSLEIGYSTLTNMIDSKESFVLLIFHNRTCGCWLEFCPIAKDFMNQYNLEFKVFDNALLEGNNSYGIYTGTAKMPGICFFRRGKLIRQTIYGLNDGKNEHLFKNYEDFKDMMLQNIYMPKMYRIDKEGLADKMADYSNFNLYVSLTDCPDCGKVEQNYILNWLDKKQKTSIVDVLYVFDIYPYNSSQDIRDFCRLGEKDIDGNVINEKFGYTFTKRGYVPTFQRWENGEIYDMITVLNDFANPETGLVTSYFSEKRINNSPILSAANYQVYDGTTISGSLTRDMQYEWHKKAVDLFFTAYVK